MQKPHGCCAGMKTIGVMIALMLLIAACSSTPKTTGGAEAREKDAKNAPLYYDFEDVLIPRDLKLNTKSSFVYRSTGWTAGVLVFTSKVERNSLIQFFDNNGNDLGQLIAKKTDSSDLILFNENRNCQLIHQPTTKAIPSNTSAMV